MTDIEILVSKLRNKFDGNAYINVTSPRRIELDVNSKMDMDECINLMKDFKDTSDVIPNSWSYNDIRIVLFIGQVKLNKKVNVI